MSCILTIWGRYFDVDTFINTSKLKPYKKSYKGQPKFKAKPDGEKLPHSLIAIETSKTDFDNLDKQITDTIRYLKQNKDKLAHLSLAKGIDHAILDFGINLRIDKKNILSQSDKFPSKLLKLAGDLGLDIQLSLYPVDMQEILEKQHSQKKPKSA